jgi:hypothetical protein
MKEKKQSKDWYIAATHYLTAGFAMPLIVGLVLSIPVMLITGENNAVLFQILMQIIWIFTIWLGIMYSAKFLAKVYVIKNSSNIIRLATVYFGVIGTILRIVRMKNIANGIDLVYIINIVCFIVGIAVFYVLSKKYIKNSEDIILAQQ